MPSQGASSAPCNHPAALLLTLLLELPWTRFPLSRSSREKMLVARFRVTFYTKPYAEANM